ncbi:MAG TPA: phosphoribosylanthranilate isomerase [Nitrospiria bacterium]|nr:phosphoribosylanthranilate isomerase [Nitrospiria bacterium]
MAQAGRIKICGLTTLKDAMAAVDAGADAVGFVCYAQSPRAITPQTVKSIIARLPPYVATVGVFANPTDAELREAFDDWGLGLAQLQGDEPPELCDRFPGRVIKAIRVKDKKSIETMSYFRVRAFLLDTYRHDQLGGTGETFDWTWARQAKRFGPVILAGGLTPQNVAKAIRTVKPIGVDVSSGVEQSLGKKDPKKVKRFIEEARKAFGSEGRRAA